MGRAASCLALLVLLGFRAPCPAAPPETGEEEAETRLVLPPIRWWGSFTYDLRQEGAEGKEAQRTQLLLTQLNAATFIWAPWIAQVTAGLTLVNGMGGAQDDAQSDMVVGNGRLHLLPMSRFPFEAWFEHTDSRVETALLGDHYSTTRWGMNQRYSNAAGDLSLYASYDHADTERADGRSDTFQGAQFDLSLPRGEHDYLINGRIVRNDSQDGRIDNAFEGLNGKHTWRPDERLSVETLASLNHMADATVGGLDSRFLQVSTLGIWRPDEKWLVTGNGRLFDLSSDSGQAESEARALAANLGASYLWRPETRLNATLSLARTDSGGASAVTGAQTLGLTHQPNPIVWDRYSYLWFAAATAANRTGGDDSGRRLALQIGHSLDRSFELWPASTLTLGAQQSLSSDIDSARDTVTRVGHGLSATWSLGGESGSAYVRISASDARGGSGPKDEFQLVNLQASLNYASGARSSWNGNLTVQGTRQRTEREPDKDFDFNASGDLTYQHSRFLGVPRLRYVSQLRLNDTRYSQRNSGQLEPISRNQETYSWENRLDYAIGRATLSLGLRAAEVQGEAQYLLQLKLTRFFGDL